MRTVVMLCAVLVACGDSGSGAKSDGEMQDEWEAEKRVEIDLALAGLDEEPDCVRAQAALEIWHGTSDYYNAQGDEPLCGASGCAAPSTRSFAEVCEEYLADEQVLCIIDAETYVEATCCYVGTPISIWPSC